MVEQNVNKYSEAISIGNFYMVEKLTELEKNEERKKKKKNVYNEKKSLLLDTFKDDENEIINKTDRRNLFCNLVEEDLRIPYLIDLSFTNPFAPYQLKFKQSEFRESLLYVGSLLNQDFGVIDDILKNQKDALKSHRKIDWVKVAAFGVGGILFFGFGGWLAAPAIGSALGSIAGLSGAAATAHGLALLGGGSIAMGGMGMAGGTWLVTGVGALAGLGISGGSPFLLELGAAQARIEILKLQVTYKTYFTTNQIHYNKVNKSIDKLVKMKEDILKEFIKEKKFNEKNSERIKDIKATIDALNNAIDWMRKHKIKV